MNEAPGSKPPIVLVHGAWGGAWIWRRVLGPFRAAGHEVHAVTLTGDGDRAHLRHEGISLQTHIDDVVALIRSEELRGVVLVGHSYGGMVVTGAAAALQADDPGALKALVYVDAMFPLPGEGWGQRHSPEVAAARIAAAAEHGNALPPPDPAEGFDLDPDDVEWLRRRHVLHPFGMYRVPLHYDGALIDALPRLFVDCTRPSYPTIDPVRRLVRETPGWQVIELHTGHFPMVTRPTELVGAIETFVDGLADGARPAEGDTDA